MLATTSGDSTPCSSRTAPLLPISGRFNAPAGVTRSNKRFHPCIRRFISLRDLGHLASRVDLRHNVHSRTTQAVSLEDFS